jgi:hypothetical protein
VDGKVVANSSQRISPWESPVAVESLRTAKEARKGVAAALVSALEAVALTVVAALALEVVALEVVNLEVVAVLAREAVALEVVVARVAQVDFQVVAVAPLGAEELPAVGNEFHS